jgi:hypothetical protein
VRPVSFAQSSDAATLPAGLALDACGVPFIADIEKFLDTCPASDPASAKVFLDAVKHKKTSNDELNPATVLIARKAGKEIAPGQTVTVQVRNPDGLLSNELTYTRSVE